VVRSELLVELEVQARDHALLDHNASVGALTADSLIDAASRLGLIDGLTRQVLLSVYAEGLSGRLAADRHQTSPEMVRYRCSRAVRRLAQHSAALADAA
jgi:DNA-directed RNA polymerase specialized sigma24 family protein